MATVLMTQAANNIVIYATLTTERLKSIPFSLFCDFPLLRRLLEHNLLSLKECNMSSDVIGILQRPIRTTSIMLKSKDICETCKTHFSSI